MTVVYEAIGLLIMLAIIVVASRGPSSYDDGDPRGEK
jgi:hypothetical protein